MKKFMSFFAAVSAGVTLMAGPVGQDRALKAARGFFADTKSAEFTLVWDGETEGTKSGEGMGAFYVFNRAGGGFVIISGDDKVQPVLGYSRTGSFSVDGMPENISHWMSDMRSTVLLVRNDPALEPISDWDRNVAASSTPVVHYETALWNQSAPYNSLCPKIFGDPTYTGCVATATAIVMRYWKWPDAGTGSLPGYTYKDDNGNEQTVSGHKLGHSYIWDSMPLADLKKGASSAEKAQVSQLIYDCAVMVEMHFDTSGSSAHLTDLVTLLPEHMKYDKAISVEQSKHFSAVSWVSMLKQGIDKGPLPYSGAGSSGGHAFVLAGYDSSDMFYINWGWGGKDNGYFAYPGFDKYVSDHTALLGVRPDMGGKGMAKLIAEKISTNTTTFVKNRTFSVTVSNIWNYGPVPFDGMIAMGKLGTDGKLEIITTAKTSSNLAFRYGWSSLTFSCKIISDIKEGDKIGVFYKIDGESQWRSVLYDLEKGGGMIPIDGLDDIAKGTSVIYSIQSHTLKVSSHNEVTISLLREDGSVVHQGKGEFECTVEEKGRCKLVLSRGDLTKTVEITL